MKVSELMNSNVVSLRPDDTVAHAATLLARHNIGALPVCAPDGRLRGMVTDRDIVLRCVAAEEDPERTRVSEIMTRRVISVGAQEQANTATELMAREQIRRLPVEENGKVIGMVSLGDFAKAPDFTTEAANALCEISENTKRL